MDHGGEAKGRPSEHPWLLASGAAIVAAVAATLSYPPESGSIAYALGQSCGYLLVPWLIAAFVIRWASWPWWATTSAAFVVFVAVLGAVATASRAAHPPVEVSAPQRIGEWSKQEDPTSRRMVLSTEARLDTLPEGMVDGDVAIGVYRGGGGAAALVAFPVGRALAAEFAADPEQGAVDYLAGASGDNTPETLDPGPLGGGLACTDEGKGTPAGGIACVWADAQSVGQVGFQVPDLTIEEAEPLMHLFRDAVMSGGAG